MNIKSAMGYIKLFRSILDWGWSDDPKTLSLWVHLLIRANWKDGEWHGEPVKRGEIITSVSKLSAVTGLSDKQVRLALDRLVRGGQIVKNGANHWTKITICDYDTYQSNDDAEGQTKGEQTADKRQATGEQGATIEEGNKATNKKTISYAEDVERIYNLYPASTIRPDGNKVSLKTRRKDCAKIETLLRAKTYTAEQLEYAIKRYLKEKNGDYAYLKAFQTFLNQVPDYGESPQEDATPPAPRTKSYSMSQLYGFYPQGISESNEEYAERIRDIVDTYKQEGCIITDG